MKQILYILLLCTTLTFAQKATFNEEKFELEFEQSELFKNLKTFSYEIQDDGKYWNHNYEEENIDAVSYEGHPTLQSLVAQGPVIKGLEKVDADADLKIVIGFLGDQLANNQGALTLDGTMNVMMFVNNDELFFNDIISIRKTIASKLSEYPTGNRFERNKSKAKILTEEFQEYLEGLDYLFTGKNEIELSFGSFKKTKKGKAEAFNEESIPLAEQIIRENTPEGLKKAIAFWTKQLEVDFGKKVKEKHKLKVIYGNIATANVLLGEYEEAKKYSDLTTKNEGFLDTFNNGLKEYLKKKELSTSFATPNLNKINVEEDNYAYYHTIKGEGVFYTGKKDRDFDKLLLERFVVKESSSITSLDKKGLKPQVTLYQDGKSKYKYSCTDKNRITLGNGDLITFKLIKGIYIPYIKKSGKEEIVFK